MGSGHRDLHREGAGPIVVGSPWHNVSKIAGVQTELTYTLKELSPDKLVFVGVNDSATSTDTISVRPAGSGSELTYRADVEMHGLAKLAAPAVKLVFEKIAHETVNQITEVLNGNWSPVPTRTESPTELIPAAESGSGDDSSGRAAMPASRARMMAAGRSAARNLASMAETLLRTVLSDSPRRAAIAAFA